MAYKFKHDRREYVRKYRLKRKTTGYYGLCTNCEQPLGRNEDSKNKSGLCIKCNYGELHQSWKGGYKTKDGYIVINIGNHTTMLQHRRVMEQHLGRALYLDETVHHKNGVRDDNRLENLELWVGAPVRGIKIKDAIAWAEEILRRYK